MFLVVYIKQLGTSAMNRQDFYDFLIKHKKENQDKIALMDSNKTITYAELYGEIEKSVAVICKDVKGNNGKLGIQVKNHAVFLAVYLAGIKLGLVIVPIYVNIGGEKCKSIINKFDIDILISEKEQEDIGKKEKKFLCMEKQLYVYKYNHDEGVLDNDIVMIMQTSGTTSEPKGVMLSTTNISSNIRAISKYLKLTETDKVLIIKNTNHVSTIVGELLVSFYEGITIVFDENIVHFNRLNKIISQNGVTVFFAVPSILNGMLKMHNNVLASLRLVNFYGEKITNHDVKELLLKFPNVNFIYSYGQTEASPRVTYIERNDMEKKLGSSGRALTGVEITIRDKNNTILSAYKEGEIVVTGPNIMRGYYKNKILSEQVLKEGKLYTGDMGYLDNEGYLYVTGRKDNMVIISGKNIHPEEIEGIIAEYPGISEVMVEVKSYKEVNGLVCYAVCHKGEVVDTKELLYFVKERTEDYKIPREVIIVPELKKTNSGKLKRNKKSYERSSNITVSK